MKDFMKKALQTLSGKATATADELEQARRAVVGRIEEVENEIAHIDNREPPPPGRREVLNTGTPQDLQELDAKLETLKAERAQLFHRRRELHVAVQDARAKESVAGAGKLHKALADAVVEAEQAIAAADAAREKAEAAARKILTARQNCKNQGVPHDDLAVDIKLARRAAAVSFNADGKVMAVELATLSRKPRHLRQQPA